MSKEESQPLTKTGKQGIYYGYIVVAAAFSIMMVIHGIVNTFGVFFNSLLTEFDSTRAALSGASSLAFFLTGLMAIFMGSLNDRFGPRIVLTVSTLFFTLGTFLMSQAGALWQIYLFLIIRSIGFSASDVIPLSTVVRWFIKKRGVMSGIMKVGTGVGMTVMPLVATALIGAFEWRKAYLILAIISLVTVIPLIQLMRRDPQEMGLLPDGENQAYNDKLVTVEEGLSLREAIRTRQLWMACGFYLIILYCGVTVLIHIVPHARELGISAGTAAGIVSTIGGMSILGRLVFGFLGDRIGHKRSLILCFAILITALSWLQVAKHLWMLYLFATIYGFCHGGFFALISPVVAGLFGTRHLGTLLGIVIFSGAIGGSAGSVLAGLIYDLTDSYQLAFLIILGLAIVGLLFTILIKPIEKGKIGDTAI